MQNRTTNLYELSTPLSLAIAGASTRNEKCAIEMDCFTALSLWQVAHANPMNELANFIGAEWSRHH